MDFQHPVILTGLFGLPLLALVFVLASRRRAALLARFGDMELIRKLSRSVNHKGRRYKSVFFILGVGFLIFALARPQYGSIEKPIQRRGVDVFVALDTSLSMRGQDVEPSRFEAAKRQIKTLVRRLEGDRIGIIAFAGEAFVACPLTLDYATAMTVLDSLELDTVPVQGTAIGKAIRQAKEAFARTEKGSKVLILFTDGEDQGTNPEDAAKEAAAADITIYSVGLGSRSGTHIRLPNGSFKEDKEGHTVNSQLDFDTLQQIAFITGGAAVLSGESSGDRAIEAIYSNIETMQKQLLESRTYSVAEERYQSFLLVGFLFLIAETLVSERRAVRKTAVGRFE